MKTVFPQKIGHLPKLIIINAENRILGHLAAEISILLRGKETSYFTPGINQGNFIIILNVSKIRITGKKESQKLYYRNSQRPGNLKMETFTELKNRIPISILEKSVWGMLPKGVLGREYYRNLYIYSGNRILYKNQYKKRKQNASSIHFPQTNFN